MKPRETASLDLTGAQFRSLVNQTLPYISRYLDGLETGNAVDVGKLNLKRIFDKPIPNIGQEFSTVLKEIFSQGLSQGIHYGSPWMMGGIPVGGLPHAAVAELIVHAVDRWPGLYNFSPGFLEIEKTCIRWLSEILGLPRQAGGNLTSGGSLANLEAIYIARNEKVPIQNLTQATAYVSDQAHHSVKRSIKMTGIPTENLRIVPTDEDCRMNLVHLREMLANDKAQGKVPFLVISAGGTVATGAIDSLVEISTICKEYNLWHHVDAAWAGLLCATKRGAKLFRGIETADSVTVDPHKALFLPFGCGAVLVRDKKVLNRAYSIDKNLNYLPTRESAEDYQNPCDNSPELSRSVRGLRIWLPIKLLGWRAFRSVMEEKLSLGDYVVSQLKTMPEIEVAPKPQLCIVAFRLKPEGLSGEDLDELNRALLERINKKGKLMISGAVIKGKFLLRIVPFGHRTHLSHVENALASIRSEITRSLK